MKISRILIALLASSIFSVSASAEPIDVNIASGSYVFVYFSSPSSPDLLTPVKDFSNLTEKFSKEKAILSIDFDIGGSKPSLRLIRYLERYKMYPCEDEFKLVNNKGFVFGENAVLGSISIATGELETIVTQRFRDKNGGEEKNLIIVISKNRYAIQSSVKIPSSYVAWEWTFADTFNYLETTLKTK